MRPLGPEPLAANSRVSGISLRPMTAGRPAVEEPDLIASGATTKLKAIKWFEDLHVGPKHLVVVYRKMNGKIGFIVTAYVTSGLERVCRRGVLWRKS